VVQALNERHGVTMIDTADLSERERALLTPAVIARWTDGLAPDDEIDPTEIVGLEKRRLQALQTLRKGADLSDQEWKLLRFLQRNEGRTCTYLQIARHLWQTPSHRVTAQSLISINASRQGLGGVVTTIHVLVHGIRYKLEIDPLRPQHLCNIRGVGYRFYSLPPSLNDGENYERRATESAVLREQLYQQLGLLEGDYVAVEDRTGTPYETRIRPGPEHPDHPVAIDADVMTAASERRP
jgi:DNA-binding response OmpR family regulator